jgi:hypothetical protein
MGMQGVPLKRSAAVRKFCSPVVLALGTVGGAQAQTMQMDQFIESMLQMHRDSTLCVETSSSTSTIRQQLVTYLLAAGVQGTVTPQTLARAMWANFPCPFSPMRPELRFATARDVEGVWIFPETSQKLRFPPRSSRPSPAGDMPVRCDALGYYPGGELRHAVIAGQTAACPFAKAADLEVARRNPQVSTWTVLRAGRLGVTRTDVANHVEEWDVFLVTTPFAFDGVVFSAGDLVAYVRKENGNAMGMATQFRHLQRLP